MVILAFIFTAFVALAGQPGARAPQRPGPPPKTGARTRRWQPLTRVANVPGYEWATKRYLRTLIYDRRQLPHSKVGGRVMVDLDQLDQLIEDGMRQGLR